MLSSVLLINLIDLVVIAVSIWVVRSGKSPVLMALIYTVLVDLVILIIVPNALEFVGPIANFVLSFVVFYLLRKFPRGVAAFFTAVIGGLAMLYVAYLPVAFLQSLILNAILQQQSIAY